MINARQIRAARALLNWSQVDLARAASLATTSIKNIENENGTTRRETLAQVQETLEANGIEFQPGDGIRRRSDVVAVHEGRDASAALIDSILTSMEAGTEKDLCIIGLDEHTLAETQGTERLMEAAERLERAAIRRRVLICEGVREVYGDPACYRWLPRDYYSRNSSFYIYGDKLAIQTGTLKPQTIIINSCQAARNLRKVFSLLWDHASVTPSALDTAPRIAG
jgi:transcriptional regulator with XRE-family HTH domain